MTRRLLPSSKHSRTCRNKRGIGFPFFIDAHTRPFSHRDAICRDLLSIQMYTPLVFFFFFSALKQTRIHQFN